MGESVNERCFVKMFWTLADLSFMKRLFSQKTAFFPDYFTRDKNGRNSFSKEFSCSCAINKFRTSSYSLQDTQLFGRAPQDIEQL